MTKQQAKDGLSKWGPTIVSVGLTLLIQVIAVAYLAGQFGQKLEDHDHRIERVEDRLDRSPLTRHNAGGS